MSVSFASYPRLLERAGILARAGFGKGLPAILPWGQAIIDRLVTVFAETCARPGVAWRVPSALVDAEAFDAEVESFGGYDDLSRVVVNGRRVVVRADACVDNLRWLLRRSTPLPEVLGVYEGFRPVKGSTPPLFRDRRIWPFLQLSRLAPSSERRERLAEIAAGLRRFFALMALDVDIVEHGPWKQYSRNRIDAVLQLPGGAPTVVAIAFEVGDAYRQAAGVPADTDAYDIGLTEKVIAVAGMMHSSDRYFVLPTALAPVEAVVAVPDVAAWTGRRWGGRRVLVVEARAGWESPWVRRGVPVLVQVTGDRVRARTGGVWRALSDASDLERLLVDHDDMLRANAMRPDRPYVQMLCERCAARGAMVASVLPLEQGVCGCGDIAVRRLYSETGAFY